MKRPKKDKKKKKAKAKGDGSRRRDRKRGLTFGFFLVVCLILCGTGVFIVAQHQMTVSAELRVRSVEQKITSEKKKQEDLRMKLARLNSPARVTRAAQDELGLAEPTGVIYLKYGRDANGNRICESSFQRWSEPPLVTMPPEATVSQGQQTPPPEGTTQNEQGQVEEITQR